MLMKIKNKPSDNGLSIVEVCISIAILAIILVPVAGIFTQGYRYLRNIRERAAAYSLARGILEEYSDWTKVTNPPEFSQTTAINNINYIWNLNISNATGYNGQLKQLNLTITWPGWPQKRFNIVTYKADY
jgi:Tfp pilus assembly protein PilV